MKAYSQPSMLLADSWILSEAQSDHADCWQATWAKDGTAPGQLGKLDVIMRLINHLCASDVLVRMRELIRSIAGSISMPRCSVKRS